MKPIRTCFCCFFVACCSATVPLRAEEFASATEPNPFDQLLRRVALDVLPHEYEDDDDWGKTKEFVTGLHVSRNGLKIETRRKRRPRNHGRWERYRVSLANEEKFLLNVRDVRATEDGQTAFTIDVSAPLKVHIRRANWRRGLQLWSISADATANVQLVLECTSQFQLDSTVFPPAISLSPHVNSAEIRMTQFRLTSVSKLGGDVADEFGDALRSYVQRKVASKGEKVAKKLNERIEKNESNLRLSLSDLTGSPLKNALGSEAKNSDID